MAAREPIDLQRRCLLVRRDPRAAHEARRSVLDDLNVIPARRTRSRGLLWLSFPTLRPLSAPEPASFSLRGLGGGGVRRKQLVEGNSAFGGLSGPFLRCGNRYGSGLRFASKGTRLVQVLVLDEDCALRQYTASPVSEPNSSLFKKRSESARSMDAEFARDYEITPDAELPSGLVSHRIYDFAQNLCKPAPNNYQVRFTTKNAKWTGVVAGEFRGPRNKVLGCPLPNEACVISGGLGYWLDVEIPQNYNVLWPLPIIYAEEVPAIGGLLIADQSRACVLTGMRETAWYKELFHDGFDSINVTGTILTFRHQPYYSASEREVIVDLVTGEVLRDVVIDANSIG